MRGSARPPDRGENEHCFTKSHPMKILPSFVPSHPDGSFLSLSGYSRSTAALQRIQLAWIKWDICCCMMHSNSSTSRWPSSSSFDPARDRMRTQSSAVDAHTQSPFCDVHTVASGSNKSQDMPTPQKGACVSMVAHKFTVHTSTTSTASTTTTSGSAPESRYSATTLASERNDFAFASPSLARS
jgi:hypothetical protein